MLPPLPNSSPANQSPETEGRRWPLLRGGPLWLLLVVLLLGACSNDAPNLPPDAGVTDQGTGEGVRPPDLSGKDAGSSGNIGAPCTPGSDAGCSGAATCLGLSQSVGICAVAGCTLEDPSTATIEDTCPAIPLPGAPGKTVATVCTRAPAAGGTFCLPSCTPSATQNSCAVFHPQVACDPVSVLYNDHSAVCLVPACSKDTDCPAVHPLHPEATCHQGSQTCLPKGKAAGKVGSPCVTNADCGNGQFCYPQRRSKSGKVTVEGGYCTVLGCAHGAPWTCPSGAKCFTIGSGTAMSMCLATGCQAGKPDASDGCRDEASPGQYDCLYLDKTQVCWLASQ